MANSDAAPDPDPNLQTNAHNGRPRRHAAELAALSLAIGRTVKAAAKRAKISERTLFVWLKKPAFRRKIAELRSRVIDTAVGRLADRMVAAADVLSRLLKSQVELTRLKAAKAVLELSTRLREHS